MQRVLDGLMLLFMLAVIGVVVIGAFCPEVVEPLLAFIG